MAKTNKPVKSNINKSVTARHGMSYGKCQKCDKEFLLKRSTKHKKQKLVKCICKDCNK